MPIDVGMNLNSKRGDILPIMHFLTPRSPHLPVYEVGHLKRQYPMIAGLVFGVLLLEVTAGQVLAHSLRAFIHG
jgi:hypothetical protein